MIKKIKQRWQNPQYSKLTALLFVIAFSIIGIFAVSSYAAVDPFHPDGTLIRDTKGTTKFDDDQIYLIQAGKKRPVSDNKILLSQGYNTKLVKNATDADLRLPSGDKVMYREGTILLGSDSLPYVVDVASINLLGLTKVQTSSRNILDDYSALSAMGYGSDLLVALFAGKITKDFPAKGLPVKNLSTHYDGTFVRNGNDFYLIENNKLIGKAYKRPILNPSKEIIPKVVKSYDYDLRSGNFLAYSKIKQATKADMALPTSTNQLDFREGTLLKSPNGDRYVVDYDDKNGAISLRKFASAESFKSLGYTDNELISIDNSTLNKYKVGAKIEFSNIITPANKPPVASFTVQPSVTLVNEAVDFNAKASTDSDGSIVKYSWDFGDDQHAEGVSVSHGYAKAATYTVVLTVTDNKGLIGKSTQNITVKPITTTVAAPITATPAIIGNAGAGYVIWDNATWWPDHLAAMPRQKPGLIRWAVSWDRQLANEQKRIVNPLDGFKTTYWPNREPEWHGTNRNTEADKFFRQLKASCYSNYGANSFNINIESTWGSFDAKRCITLVVSQHGVKDSPFDWPARIGACPSGAASTCHWPDFKNGTLASYMQELYDILRSYLPKEKIVWEDFNEADLRWGSKKQSNPYRSGATMNYTSQWNPQQKGGNLYTYGTTAYTGGTGENWVKMHQLVKDKAGSTTPIVYSSGSLVAKYNYEPENETTCPDITKTNSSQKSCHNDEWVKATAPLVGISSYHNYSDENYMTAGPINDGSNNDFETKITEYMDMWKKHKGFDMPFYIGEIGPDANGSYTAVNKSHAIALAERHAYLQDASKSPRTAGKYIGMAMLDRVGTYRVNAWQTRYGWWDSRFDPDDVVTTN